MDTTTDNRPAASAEAPAAAAAPATPSKPAHRLNEVLEVVKMELVNAGIGADERRRGFNPYDGRLGRANRDIWGQPRRA